MDYSGIKTFADDLIGTDDTKYPVAKKLRHANEALRRIHGLIMSTDGGKARYDDDNFTSTPPYVTENIVSGTREIQLLDDGTNDVIKIIAIQVKDSSGTFNDIEVVDIRSPEGRLIRQGNGETGTPTRCVIVGSWVVFDYIPDYSSTGGMKAWVSRGSHPFELADDTEEPGFVEDYHVLIPYWMAYWQGMYLGKRNTNAIRAEITVQEQALVEYYQNLDSDSETRMKTSVDDPR